MLASAYNPSTWEAGTEGSDHREQPGPDREALSPTESVQWRCEFRYTVLPSRLAALAPMAMLQILRWKNTEQSLPADAQRRRLKTWTGLQQCYTGAEHVQPAVCASTAT